VFVVIVTGLVMGWLAKARMRQRHTSEAGKLVHPVSTLVIGLLPMVLFFGIAVVSNTFGKTPPRSGSCSICALEHECESPPCCAAYPSLRRRTKA
jgi:hypothetical protein